MDFQGFKHSLEDRSIPDELTRYLQALWYAGKNNWEQAHLIAQDIDDAGGSWIHAYLHRWEGDKWNAGYWYRKADRAFPDYSLEKEWEILVKHFLR